METRNYGEISDLETQMHNIQDKLQHEDLTTLEIAGVGAACAESQVPRHEVEGPRLPRAYRQDRVWRWAARVIWGHCLDWLIG